MASPVWHPYAHLLTQQAAPKVVGGEGPRFTLEGGETLLDATCSWWCMIHGYAHPRLVTAIKEQAGTLCHVMLGGLTHEPADRLASELVRVTPPGLDHVFFSDSGSVGMEVAMKMAVQYQHLRGKPGKHRMLSLMKAYHGDTSGCMAVCDPEEGMHSLFAGYLPQHHFAPAPTAPYDAGPEAVARDIAALRAVLERHHDEIAALLMEPLLQAAGGLNMTSPHYLKGARELCDEFDVLLVFDEVATGFGRTGKLFAADHAEVTPDIMVLSKGLTGGYLGHAATLATDRVHDTFIGDSELHAFMPYLHGQPTGLPRGAGKPRRVRGRELPGQDRRPEPGAERRAAGRPGAAPPSASTGCPGAGSDCGHRGQGHSRPQRRRGICASPGRLATSFRPLVPCQPMSPPRQTCAASLRS